MGMSSTFVGALLLVILIQAKGQPGFISIDCGAEAGVNYTDPSLGINYVSDANFINTGVRGIITSEETSRHTQRQLWTLRSFPEGKTNCYTINITRGSKYLIRTVFLYGNYDGLNISPQFDLLLGANLWDTVTIRNASITQSNEIIHVPLLDFIQICLVNTGNGTPFITAIELRTLTNDIYVTESGSLERYLRCDLGSNTAYRYSADVYDRFWLTCDIKEVWTQLSASISDDSFSENDYKPGATIMSTAVTPANGNAPLVLSWEPEHETDEFYVYMHFTELQVLTENQTRQFNIMRNGELRFKNFSPEYMSVNTIYTTSAFSGKVITYSLERTENSTLPPIINAIEIYKVKQFNQSDTFQGDGSP